MWRLNLYPRVYLKGLVDRNLENLCEDLSSPKTWSKFLRSIVTEGLNNSKISILKWKSWTSENWHTIQHLNYFICCFLYLWQKKIPFLQTDHSYKILLETNRKNCKKPRTKHLALRPIWCEWSTPCRVASILKDAVIFNFFFFQLICSLCLGNDLLWIFSFFFWKGLLSAVAELEWCVNGNLQLCLNSWQISWHFSALLGTRQDVKFSSFIFYSFLSLLISEYQWKMTEWTA